MVEKKDSFQLNEKFGHLRVAPSVKSFGGRPLEGCLVVSSTGMVGVIVLAKDSQTGILSSTSESLAAMRNRITTADICYGKSRFILRFRSFKLLDSNGLDYHQVFHVIYFYLHALFVSDGDFLVAVSSGNIKLPIQCYRVSVKRVDDKCQITSQALPSFFLQNMLTKEVTCKSLNSSVHYN